MSAIATFGEYVGREERRSEVLDAHRVAEMAAVLDVSMEELAPAGRLPKLAHWLYFIPWARQSELGTDGHPRRGGFMPPIELPRRMFAGGRLTFHRDLFIGEMAERVVTIMSIKPKTGSSGELVFVTVRHQIFGANGLAVEEEQDIVYRDDAPNAGGSLSAKAPPAEPVPEGALTKTILVDPVLLFRFSALTSNAHRIHYDRPYATGVEHYPGLVVHGPLQALLLLELVRARFPRETVAQFRFQARRPIFDDGPFTCVALKNGSTIDLSTRSRDGLTSMTALAELQ
jgi:3-methylfumaryl-CoA hydratase